MRAASAGTIANANTDRAHEGPRTRSEDQSFLGRLTRERLLTAEEEAELANQVKLGGRLAKAARDRLIEANMRLVLSVARSYHNPMIPFEDLVQEGAIGLMSAVERFDPSKGCRFSTYATHWIRQAISRAIDGKAKAIRVPAHISESLRKLERARASLAREQGEEPTADQLARETGLTIRKVNALIQANMEPVSLDMLIGGEESATLASMLNDESATNPQDAVLSADMQRMVYDLLDVLTPRERQVMRRRLGFDGDDSEVLQGIGDRLSLSRERVRQIEVQALRKLKAAARRKDLLGYICA